ncbi:MAG: hypothetical protein NZM10_04205, partial [Fimbriimonadales bacterium]|nr:hypothetical protein [Fimbriimonadales bacterium]
GLGVAALIAFSIVWLARAPKPEPTTTVSPPSVAQAVALPAEPAAKRVALAMPLPADAVRLQLPAQATLSAKRSPARQPVPQAPTTPAVATGQAAVIVVDTPQPTDLARRAVPRAPAPEIATEAAPPHHKATGAEAPPTLTAPLEPTSPPLQIASLPLNQFRLLEGGDAYYLPFNYGTSSHKESDNYAVVGSF